MLYEPRRKAALQGLWKNGRSTRTHQVWIALKSFGTSSTALNAQKALQRFNKTYQFHTIIGEVTSSQRWPNLDPLTFYQGVTDWHLRLTITRDDEAIAQAQKPLGKYIIATNVCDEQTLPTEELQSPLQRPELLS